MTIRAALIGCGAWGLNLLRVVASSPRANLVVVADPSPSRRRVARSLAPDATLVSALDEALGLGVDAVLIAAPPHLHAGLVLRALGSGADVFVEKPMAMRAADAERCVTRAAALGRVAMVGHLLAYHPTVEALVHAVHDGAVGRPAQIECVRRSVAGDRSWSALWTLGPHDVSVIQAIDGSSIASLAAHAGGGGDPVAVEIELASGLRASIHLSRASATKERRIRVLGRTGVLEFDDVRAPDRFVLSGREMPVPWEEPLAREIEHFLRCVEDRTRPRTSFDDGLAVVQALARAEEAIGAAPFAADEAAAV